MREAQKNFKEFGAIEKRLLKYVRRPGPDDIFDKPKEMENVHRVPIDTTIREYCESGKSLGDLVDLYIGIKEPDDFTCVYDPEQLYQFLDKQEILNYQILLFKDHIAHTGKDPDDPVIKMKNLSVEESEKYIKNIKEKFVQKVKERYHLT